MTEEKSFRWSQFLYTLIRISIAWHFLYEGMSKVMSKGWSSEAYLSNSTGFLSSFYHWLASSDALLKVLDVLNVYGLILIGLVLFLGLLVRYASVLGVFMLLLYYFAYPPFGASVLSQTQGSYFVINTVLIEAIVLMFFAIKPEVGYGLENFILYLRRNKELEENGTNVAGSGRREALRHLSAIPLLGFLGLGALNNHKKHHVDVMSGATIQLKQTALKDLKGDLPKGKLGEHEISRLIMGGNMIGGWAHARDLIYVSSLFKAYNTEKKIYETLMLAEKAGINTINIGFVSNAILAKYKRLFGSKIKVISQVAPNMKKGDYFDQINRAIDKGADILQVQGNWCDWLVKDQKYDVIEAMLEKIREQGYTAGLGAHTVDALIACEEQGIIPDYYMKTMHHDNYWSAHPKENRVPFEVDGRKSADHNHYHNNIFCLFPDKSAAFVERAKVPVVGFKVLAAGAIEPEDGFNWAFQKGADFICVGMFDFQLVNDVNICIDTINKLEGRTRQWFA